MCPRWSSDRVWQKRITRPKSQLQKQYRSHKSQKAFAFWLLCYSEWAYYVDEHPAETPEGNSPLDCSACKKARKTCCYSEPVNVAIRPPKPPLCKGGVARRSRDGGIVCFPKVLICCHDLTIPQSKIKDFCQLPLHKGAFGCSRTSAFFDVSQKEQRIIPHSSPIWAF